MKIIIELDRKKGMKSDILRILANNIEGITFEKLCTLYQKKIRESIGFTKSFLENIKAYEIRSIEGIPEALNEMIKEETIEIISKEGCWGNESLLFKET